MLRNTISLITVAELSEQKAQEFKDSRNDQACTGNAVAFAEARAGKAEDAAHRNNVK